MSNPLSRIKKLLIGASVFAFAIEHGISAEFADYSIEQLSNVPVVMSAKKDARLFDAPTGAYVFDEDAIANLPVDSIPEMLRYAPGVHILRSTNGSWGIGIRGRNSRFFNRVQFNVDDQSVYGNLTGGFFGVQHDLPLEDVASIEVVYGPGGGMWGSNSANGRVNVVMKSAFETEGSYLKTQYGTHNKAVSSRYGWSLNDKTSARVYLKMNHREESDSEIFNDDWDRKRAGFQIDTRPSFKDLFSFSAEAYESTLGFARSNFSLDTGDSSVFLGEEIHEGYNGQFKWTRQTDSENGFTLRTWGGVNKYDIYDYWNTGIEGRLIASLSDNQSIVVTAGGAFNDFKTADSNFLKFQEESESRVSSVHSGAEYTYTPNGGKIDLVIGFNGSDDSQMKNPVWLPSAKLTYRLSNKDRLWASFTQSSKPAPAGFSDLKMLLLDATSIDPIDIQTPYGLISIDQVVSYVEFLKGLENEDSDAFQLGYRREFNNSSSLVVNAFYYKYHNVFGGMDLSFTPVLFAPKPYARMNIGVSNIADGDSYGFETSYDLIFNSAFSSTLNYAYIQDEFEPTILPAGASLENFPGLANDLDKLNKNVPEHNATIWLKTQVNDKIRADICFRYTSSYSNTTDNQPSIFQSDIRFSWEPQKNIKASIVGRNLLDSKTSEDSLADNFGYGTEQEREVYFELLYNF